MSKRPTRLLSVALCLILFSASAAAEPILQLYIPGAVYDQSTETWSLDLSGSNTFTLWAIGNVAGNGGKGTIFDVNLVAAYAHGLTPTISFAGTTTASAGGAFSAFRDPSTPTAPGAPVYTSTSGTEIPLMGDGDALPQHGEYGANTDWQKFALGNFSLTDSACADFSGNLPIPSISRSSGCQISAYMITVTGVDSIHFDLFNHVGSTTRAKYVFAPFSHDAGTTTVPEPGSLVLLSGGLLALGVYTRRKS